MATVPCPFCAEKIQSEAVLCRFCGAKKQGGSWNLPAPAKALRGSGVLKSSGWLFILSGLFEVYSISSPVAIFGALRGGAMAFAYHGIFAALFLACGIGLVMLRYWGYQSLIAVTILYSIERVMYLADAKTRAADFSDLGVLGGFLDADGMETLQRSIEAWVLLLLVSWWLLALYAYYRRGLFRRD